MTNSKRNSKLQATLNQWTRILNKELSISYDLRKQDVCQQANTMILKLTKMMES